MKFIIFLMDRVDLRLSAQGAHRKMPNQDLGKASQETIVKVRSEGRKGMSQKRRRKSVPNRGNGCAKAQRPNRAEHLVPD